MEELAPAQSRTLLNLFPLVAHFSQCLGGQERQMSSYRSLVLTGF